MPRKKIEPLTRKEKLEHWFKSLWPNFLGYFKSIAWPYFKKNWLSTIFIILILVGSTILRFWGMRTNLHVDVDEATHTQTIYSIFQSKHLILQGPPASGGTNLYHGAFYYYLYLIPAILSAGNPLGLGAFTAILSVASVFLLYRAILNQFGKIEAAVATTLYAISYIVILYGRWIWNPNVIPFFLTLALFAATGLARGREKYLILFTFAISAIEQLHVGGMFFIGVYILLLPYLIKITKNKKIWAWSIALGALVWLPTIVNELHHNFPFIRAFIDLLKRPSHSTLWTHITSGYNYFAFMHDTILHLGNIIFIASLVAGIVTLIFCLRKFRDAHSSIFPAFLLLTIIFTFAMCAYYPGTLFIHFAEQLFVIFPILTMFLLAPIFKNKGTVLGGVAILIYSATMNWNLYYKDIVVGDREFGTENKICQIVKDDSKGQAVEITINGQENPIYITYICQNDFQINFGTQLRYNFSTDFKDNLRGGAN